MPWDMLAIAALVLVAALRLARQMGRRSGERTGRDAECARWSAELDAVRVRLKANSTFTGCWYCGRAEVFRAGSEWLCVCGTRGEGSGEDEGEGEGSIVERG